MSGERFKVTALEAALLQLKTAIRLYFEDDDPVSVHTLVKAAGEVIDRMCRENGTPSMRDDLLNEVVQHRRKEIADKLNANANFFKHADKPDAEIAFFKMS